MQPLVTVLNLFISWRDRNVPPIGLTAFFCPLAKAEIIPQTCFTMCFLLFVFCSSIVYSAPPFWTQGRQISAGSAFSSEVDACSRDDEVYVVWSDDRTGNKEIFFTYSLNAGQSWSKEERLTDTIGESAQPAIACDMRNLHVVWREKTAKTARIYYKKWNGQTWSDDLLLSDDHENSNRPEIASTTTFPGSYLYVVWDSEEDGRTTAYLTRSNDSGQSFSDVQPVTSGNWSTKESIVWGGARDAYIAWVDNREIGWNVFFKRWGEVQTGQDIKLSAMPDCHRPAIGGIEPEVYVTWQCVEKGEVYADVYFASSASNGVNWSRAQKLTNGEAESVFPRVTVSDRTPWVFWQDGQNGEWQVVALMLDDSYWMLDSAERISSILYLTDVSRPSILVDTVSTPGQIHAFWTRLEVDSQALIYMRRDTVAPERPGTPFHFDLTSVSGYDDDNQVTFSWEASESGGVANYKVYSSANNVDIAPEITKNTSYNVPGESGKTYQVYVEAVDEVGNASAPSGLSPEITCDPDKPDVMIHSPSWDSTVRGDTPVIVSVQDINLLEYVVEYGVTAVPSVWQPLAGPFQEEVDRKRIMTWETAALQGIYTLRIRARDKAGNESKAEAIVNVDSRPPVTVLPGEAMQLTDPDAGWTYGTPAWSPEGDKIAFYSDEGGTEDIWVMSPADLQPIRRRLTRSIAVEHNPAWSPFGDMIAFQSFTEDGLWDIWVVDIDSGEATQITSDENSDMNPTWSPDGTSIAFDSDRDGDGEIFLIANIPQVLTGTEPERIQLTDNDWEDMHPDWSPDGSRIVFQSSRRGNWDLFMVDIDGENMGIIVESPADEIEPDWSPDRKRVLFSTNESGDHYEIYSVDWPEVSERVRLSPKGQDARHASWSPAMDSIVYEHEGSLYSAALLQPMEDLEAIISWPRGGEVLTGSVDVQGIARGRGFQEYSLYYSDGSSDDILIGGESTLPVPEKDFLGRWNTQELEGEYVLKLVVAGENGGFAEDSVRVLIANQLPFILIDEPKNNLITDKQIINVSGRTGPRVMITLNNDEVDLELDGSFSRKVQLSEEGENTIIIRARSPSGSDGEYVLERTVILDTRAPEIELESPVDFQLIHVPYVTVEGRVKGRVDERAEVSVLSNRVWPDENGSFQRRILCNEGTNVITVAAFDELGHYSSEVRRVIFKRKTEITSDTSAPVIAEVFPDNRAVVTGRNVQVSATLVDDVGLDPLSIVFSLGEEEIDSEKYILDIELPDEAEDFPPDRYPLIHFTYRLAPPVDEGAHSFKIEVQDTSGNKGESSYSFSVDTVPPEATVSALLDGPNQIKVVASSNKPLIQINGGSVYIPPAQYGYSLSSFIHTNGHYEAFLDISPSQRSFVIDFAARTYLGKEVNARGYMSWDEARSDERLHLGVEGVPQFFSSPVVARVSKLTLIMRSQDGLDDELEPIALQRSDAEYRRLRPSGLVYVLSASEELREGEIQGTLSLPASDVDFRRLVMFHWDDETKRWQPLDGVGVSAGSGRALESHITELGVYALFADNDPPVIKDVSPMGAAEVPLDRFFVEAVVSDEGSGISEIKLMIDGKEVAYDYDALQGILTYFPSNLEWGLHGMEIIATDRAGNEAEFSTSFVTQEVFQFITVRAYPNPARNIDVNIEFKLTRIADVILRIYTVSGELVYSSEKKKAADGTFVWKRKNNAGNKVASGVYIYSIEAVLYETKIHEKGSIAIVM